MIGKDIVVMVMGVQGNQVRVGVQAPTQLAVHREEVFDRIREEEIGVRPVLQR